MVQMVMVANFFLALASDTFYSVRKTDTSQLLKRKAMAIDACEAALTDEECKEIEYGMHTSVDSFMTESVRAARRLESMCMRLWTCNGIRKEMTSLEHDPILGRKVSFEKFLGV